jgi:hypothetical protein
MENNSKSGFQRSTVLELLNLGIESANAIPRAEPPLTKPEGLSSYLKEREASDQANEKDC